MSELDTSKNDKILNLAPDFDKRAKAVMYGESYVAFCTEMDNMINTNQTSSGVTLGNSLSLIEDIHSGMDFTEVLGKLDSFGMEPENIQEALRRIFQYSKKGPEFIRFGKEQGLSEFQNFSEEQVHEQEQANSMFEGIEYVQSHEDEIKSFVSAGSKFMFSPKVEEWENDVRVAFSHKEAGVAFVSSMVDLMQKLEDGVPFEDVEAAMETHLQTKEMAVKSRDIRNHLLAYSKQGPDFETYYLEKHPEVASPLRHEEIANVITENAGYITEELGQKMSREDLIKSIMRNRGMKDTLLEKEQKVDLQLQMYSQKNGNDKEDRS